MNKFKIIIPARMDSGRLERKMLIDIVGLPMIVRVAQQALKSKAEEVIVATDHINIFNACQEYQIKAIMTREDHKSGTDRLSEVVEKLNLKPEEIVINVQGDEPLIDPLLINQLADFITQRNTPVATIAHPIFSEEEIFNPNVVKTVLNHNSEALYFSRAPIPYYRKGFNNTTDFKLPQSLNLLRHIGIYAYQCEFLKTYHRLASCPLEDVEALEQLRVLYHGYKIGVLITKHLPSSGIDTLEDLIRVKQLILATEK